MKHAKLSVGVLASGNGTNLQALLDGCAAGTIDARIAVVLSDVPGAFALERARTAGVPAIALDRQSFQDRAAFEAALLRELQAHDVGLVVLAGFMRLLSGALLGPYRARVLNIHPSLLPSFAGLHAPRQALEHGAKLAGCTVHFVDEGTDTGPIVAQRGVPVLEGDDEGSLHARIQLEERQLLPLAVDAFAGGRLRLRGRTVDVDGGPL